MNQEHILGQITVEGEPITLVRTSYADGRPAVIARSVDGAYGVLSVNPGPSVELSENCIAVKSWSENAPLFAAASVSGLFMPTGRQIRLGHGVAPIWQIGDSE